MDETKTSVRTGSVPDGWTMNEAADGRGVPFSTHGLRDRGEQRVCVGVCDARPGLSAFHLLLRDASSSCGTRGKGSASGRLFV